MELEPPQQPAPTDDDDRSMAGGDGASAVQPDSDPTDARAHNVHTRLSMLDMFAFPPPRRRNAFGWLQATTPVGGIQ
ncbi:MAG: hypothetical protein JNL79_19200 [Myxococcales bacterium]|nr:hypothetical protein [Myxococcales bacterium]